MKTYKKIILLITVLLVIFILSYIFTNTRKESKENTSSEYTEVLGYLEHGAAQPNISLDNKLLPFIYTGGEYSLKYYLNTKGSADTIGFMVFIDGELIKSKIESENQYVYCNYVEINEDKENYNFSINFTPPDLELYNTYDLEIVSIYNVLYQPNMKSEFSYNINQSALASVYELTYEQNGKGNEEKGEERMNVSSSSIEYEKITDKTAYSDFGIDNKDNVNLNKSNIYSAVYVNGKNVKDNIGIDGKELHITYKIIGTPDITYKTTFFLNHEPILINDLTFFKSTVKESNITVIDLSINTDLIMENSSFYVVTIPEKLSKYTDQGLGIYKTQSILFIPPNSSTISLFNNNLGKALQRL